MANRNGGQTNQPKVPFDYEKLGKIKATKASISNKLFWHPDLPIHWQPRAVSLQHVSHCVLMPSWYCIPPSTFYLVFYTSNLVPCMYCIIKIQNIFSSNQSTMSVLYIHNIFLIILTLFLSSRFGVSKINIYWHHCLFHHSSLSKSIFEVSL